MSGWIPGASPAPRGEYDRYRSVRQALPAQCGMLAGNCPQGVVGIGVGVDDAEVGNFGLFFLILGVCEVREPPHDGGAIDGDCRVRSMARADGSGRARL